MLFDTHAHYDDEAFDADRDELLSAMPGHSVGLIVNPGCTVASSRAAVTLAERFPHVYAAVGIHPENCGDFIPAHMDEIRELAKHRKVVAVGEIGLDARPVQTVVDLGDTGDIVPGRCSSRCFAPIWRWRRSWICPSSSTTGRHTPTVWIR